MKLTTRFCQTCNARDRIIQHGRCITCGYRPETKYGVRPELWEASGRDSRLGVGHIWTNVRCPAYRTLDGADCRCGR